MPKQLLSTNEAAEILGVNVETVREYCDCGLLRHLRPKTNRGTGKRPRYKIPLSAIEELLKKSQPQPTVNVNLDGINLEHLRAVSTLRRAR